MSPPRVHAPGKAMWLGEYVVLDGAPALVAAVDRHAYCDVTPHRPALDDRSLILETSLSPARWELRDRAGVVSENDTEEFRLLRAVVETLAEAGVPLPEAGGSYRFSTDALNAETKLGLGSSAAVAAVATVALSGGDAPHLGDAASVYALALRAHHRFQSGVGSGSDVAAACLGGVLRIEAGQAPRRLDITVPSTVVIYTGESADTRAFVRAVSAQRELPEVRRALASMRRHAIAGADALEAGALADFLAAVRAFHRDEQALTAASGVPVVTPAIAQAVALMEQCGGAAKASGAGGGDIVIAFFEDAARRAHAVSLAVQAGLDVIPLAVEGRGVLDSLPSDSKSSIS